MKKFKVTIPVTFEIAARGLIQAEDFAMEAVDRIPLRQGVVSVQYTISSRIKAEEVECPKLPVS